MIAVAAFLWAGLCSCDRDPSLGRIKQAGQIRLAMSTGYSPFCFHNDRKELVGFDVDVARELSRRLGVELKIVDTPWEGIIDGLYAHRYDGILGSMSITDERRARVSFSTPYYYSRTRVMVRLDSPFKTHTDLRGRTIGFAIGTTFEKDADRMGAKNFRRYASDDDALMGLQKGEVDAVITDEIVGTYTATRKKYRIGILGGPLGEEQIAAAFRREDAALLAVVDHALKAMQKDGTLRLLMEKMVREGY